MSHTAGRSKVAEGAEADGLIPGTDIPAAPRFIDVLSEAMASPGLRKGERTRHRILWATGLALSRSSFAELSMDAIAEIAAVSRPALYQYVGSKEDAVRSVLTAFQSEILRISVGGGGRSVFEGIVRTNRHYIDYYAKNAVFMERVRELHAVMPEIVGEKQRVNRRWAERVVAHVARHTQRRLPSEVLRMRVLALECMIDDVLREIFVVGNPDLDALGADHARLAEELSQIWFQALYRSDE